jgi:rod shape-determining protein MreD
MYLKILTYFAALPFIFSVQASLINGLPEIFHFNLIIVASVVILLIFGRDEALWSAIGFGLLYDLYSFSHFGINIIILPVMILFADLLLVKFFTNKSLYSFLALVLFCSIFYDIIIWGINILQIAILLKKSTLNTKTILPLFLPILMNLLVVTVVFYIINYISDRLKPVFLIRNQKL